MQVRKDNIYAVCNKMGKTFIIIHAVQFFKNVLYSYQQFWQPVTLDLSPAYYFFMLLQSLPSDHFMMICFSSHQSSEISGLFTVNLQIFLRVHSGSKNAVQFGNLQTIADMPAEMSVIILLYIWHNWQWILWHCALLLAEDKLHQRCHSWWEWQL